MTSVDGLKEIEGKKGKLKLPDDDSIKMFVGQIPRNMGEVELRPMFEEFGPVYEIKILRDKETGESKGCCFVTFYTKQDALAAQAALNNIRTLAPLKNSIKMKPADVENRKERKIFVGMISHKWDEPKLKDMFDKFGSIEDLSILRDSNGKSRGCAFITYRKQKSAQDAINEMNQSIIAENCSSPINVKIADTTENKDIKDQSSSKRFSLDSQRPLLKSAIPRNYSNPSNLSTMTSFLNNFSSPSQSLNNSMLYQNGDTSSDLLSQYSNNQALNWNSLMSQSSSMNSSRDSMFNMDNLCSSLASSQIGNPIIKNFLQSQQQTPFLFESVNENFQNLFPNNNNNNTVGNSNSSALNDCFMRLRSNLPDYHSCKSDNFISNRQEIGPEKSNLFIYHLPVIFVLLSF